ncbi:orotidine 5'-phosphate decarboxylase [Candidatus Micrarchaeota archaeon]|nr:orotidine 5'-phosphate decarboxylase [Candidatus Micrarchaeota archaeon]
MMAELQVALDFLKIKDALGVAGKCKGMILEAGTPLIKSEGIRAVSELRRKFPDSVIMADLKIMDTGHLEVKLAADAGANIVTVLGAAPIETIEEAIKAGKQFNVKIMVDLMNVENKAEKIKLIKGADYFLLHTGIDEQKTKNSFNEAEFKVIRENSRAKLAVAGGINPENIRQILKLKPDLVIVGSAITKSKKVEKTASELNELIHKN